MADTEDQQPNDFSSRVHPPENIENLPEVKRKKKQIEDKEKTQTQIRQDTVDTSVLSAQNKVISGLSAIMTDFQIENMKSLAPRDEFEIPQGSGHIYKRNKMKPAMIRKLREAERIYNADVAKIEDPDLKLDRDWQLLQFKAELYFGMSKQEFEDTDVEYLQTVIQATELRTQGFRQY